MSLMDTIKGAREEAAANLPVGGKETVSSSEENAAGSSSQQGFTRKSASKAKPKRAQSEGVRKVSSNGKPKSKTNQSKEELKAERRHDREVSDLRYNVTQKVLEEREEYQVAHKTWMRLLIAGVVLMVVAVGLYIVVSNMGTEAPEALGIAGLVVMVAAYLVVIVALIYDWRTIRPMRRNVEKYVDSMSEKRLVTAINKGVKVKK